MKKKFKNTDIKAIIVEDYASFEYDIVEDSGWLDEGKYAAKDIIFLDKSDNKHYELCTSRSGDAYSDYYYDWDIDDSWEDGESELTEVHAVEVVTTQWKAVDG